jgi:hypothetical protein
MRRLEKNIWKLKKDEYRSFVPEFAYGNIDEFQEIKAKKQKDGVYHLYSARRHGGKKHFPVILIVK